MLHPTPHNYFYHHKSWLLSINDLYTWFIYLSSLKCIEMKVFRVFRFQNWSIICFAVVLSDNYPIFMFFIWHYSLILTLGIFTFWINSFLCDCYINIAYIGGKFNFILLELFLTDEFLLSILIVSNGISLPNINLFCIRNMIIWS